MKKEILDRLAPMNYMPIIFASAIEKQRIFQAVEAALQVFENRSRKIKTAELNDIMLAAIEHHPPPLHRVEH